MHQLTSRIDKALIDFIEAKEAKEAKKARETAEEAQEWWELRIKICGDVREPSLC